jgi:HSP20 family protein
MAAGLVSPAFEVKETRESLVFKADVPGTREQDIDVNVAGNRLTIAGKREAEKEEKNQTFYAHERTYYGTFPRTFTLPDQTDPSHVKAELKNCELAVVVPKTAAVAKRIPVASGTSSG